MGCRGGSVIREGGEGSLETYRIRRISRLPDRTEGEADVVVAAVSSTVVHFTELKLDEALGMSMDNAPPPGPDVSIVHDTQFNGVIPITQQKTTDNWNHKTVFMMSARKA